MKNIFLSLFFVLNLTACTSSTVDPVEVQKTSNCDQFTIIDPANYASIPTSSYPQGVSIQQISIIGDCFKIQYSSSGCSANTWVVNLYSDGALDTSTTPATRKVKFSLVNNEMCLAQFQREKSFDIENLRAPGANSVQIKLENNSQTITYNY